PILRLAEGAIDGARLHVINVAAVRALREALGETAGDERLEEIAHVLAVLDAGERRVLTPQAIATVQGHERQKPRLPRREPKGFQRHHTLLERHANRSK